MSTSPLPNGSNGRGGNGRFGKGNAGGPGNPYARRVAELRASLFDAIGPDDVRAVVKALLRQAKAGDVPSIRELLQRTFGPPESADLLERIDELEAKLNELVENRGRSWRT